MAWLTSWKSIRSDLVAFFPATLFFTPLARKPAERSARARWGLVSDRAPTLAPKVSMRFMGSIPFARGGRPGRRVMGGIGGGLPGLPPAGGSFWTGAGLHLRGGFPPGPGRGRGRVLRTLRVVELLRCHGVQRPGGSPSSAAGPAGTGAGWHLPRGFPPGPGRGIQAFSRESPDAKSRGGMPPAPPFFIARSFPLARFGVVGRSGAIVGLFQGPGTCPDLDSHFAGAGFGEESILWRGHTTHEGFSPRGRLWGRETLL